MYKIIPVHLTICTILQYHASILILNLPYTNPIKINNNVCRLIANILAMLNALWTMQDRIYTFKNQRLIYAINHLKFSGVAY